MKNEFSLLARLKKKRFFGFLFCYQVSRALLFFSLHGWGCVCVCRASEVWGCKRESFSRSQVFLLFSLGGKPARLFEPHKFNKWLVLFSFDSPIPHAFPREKTLSFSSTNLQFFFSGLVCMRARDSIDKVEGWKSMRWEMISWSGKIFVFFLPTRVVNWKFKWEGKLYSQLVRPWKLSWVYCENVIRFGKNRSWQFRNGLNQSLRSSRAFHQIRVVWRAERGWRLFIDDDVHVHDIWCCFFNVIIFPRKRTRCAHYLTSTLHRISAFRSLPQTKGSKSSTAWILIRFHPNCDSANRFSPSNGEGQVWMIKQCRDLTGHLESTATPTTLNRELKLHSTTFTHSNIYLLVKRSQSRMTSLYIAMFRRPTSPEPFN